MFLEEVVMTAFGSDIGKGFGSTPSFERITARSIKFWNDRPRQPHNFIPDNGGHAEKAVQAGMTGGNTPESRASGYTDEERRRVEELMDAVCTVYRL
jgi:hypothetical protein